MNILFHGHRATQYDGGWIGSGSISGSNGGNIVGIQTSKLIIAIHHNIYQQLAYPLIQLNIELNA